MAVNLEQEIKKLQRELAKAKQQTFTCSKCGGVMYSFARCVEMERLEAENAKLREALEKITGDVDVCELDYADIFDIAKQALAKGTK